MGVEGRICLLGFGEVGQVFAEDLMSRSQSQVSVFDVLFDDDSSGPSVERARRPELAVFDSAAKAVENCGIVISVVTASEAVSAVLSIQGALDAGAFYVDMNSVSPGTSRRIADVVDGTGARFVEAAIMSPIAARRIGTPTLPGGPNAAAWLDIARDLGFSGAEVFSTEVGPASAAKMCRSVIVKGIEALLGESLATARHYGVEQTVIESLHDLLPLDDWDSKAAYMIRRSVRHGSRRADEMREVARTVAEAGIEPWMSEAAATRQEWAASHPRALTDELTDMLDALIEEREESS